MKKTVFFLTTLAVLTGCEYTPMYKEGATPQETNVTQAQCNTFAANTVPPHIVTDWYPIYGANGQVIGSRPETYDINEGRRHTAVKNCMQEQGFTRASIPYCPKDALETNEYRPLPKSPPLTDTICAVRQSDGSRVLIDLSKPVN
ncbi:membrane lipoprotein lipid attachment site-containing protein [Shimia abyssi]|uniref:Lipoprotein n=1 Tax=Shimia abyssi TaxID=1662395 RepID=A0A2P8F6J6_9RHOB|nr:membrane lipoprotein lipid attachment site-containing protein [Shimia abyssi]PSL17339.1 hypothetical protein CLV88_11814 [Shimia abyssi]